MVEFVIISTLNPEIPHLAKGILLLIWNPITEQIFTLLNVLEDLLLFYTKQGN